MGKAAEGPEGGSLHDHKNAHGREYIVATNEAGLLHLLKARRIESRYLMIYVLSRNAGNGMKAVRKRARSPRKTHQNVLF